MNLKTQIKKVPKISDKYAARLSRLGIKNLGDLLFHFPHRYQDFSKITPARKAEIGETICVKGKIAKIENERTSRQRMVITKALLKDDSGFIQALWFRQPYLKETLTTQKEVCLAGKVELGKEGLFLSNPVYEKISKRPQIHTGRVVPVYPETEGVSSRWLRYVLFPLIKKFAPKLPETLPQKLIEEENLLPLGEALSQIHFPESLEKAKKARYRFSFEELFLLELKVLKEKMATQKEDSFKVPFQEKAVKEFVKNLPFELTTAQKKASWEILKDMEKDQPMRRLLQGDVGSGKTVVAAIAALNVSKNGFQSAFMAPTEILAGQHFKSLSKALKPFNLKVALLTGSESKLKEEKTYDFSKNELLEEIEKGAADIVVGTHALIQDGVRFHKLALAVVDEQHRFGVKQRSNLIKKRKPRPHLLTMTATPIPRSLALTAYGDLDISLIDELPKGRKEIETKLVSPKERKVAYDFIREEIKKGRQAFVICPRIRGEEESSWSEVKSVEEEYEKLSQKIFKDLEVERLHGRLSSEEKQNIMKKFKKGEIDVLVSTSVVEVGVDIPNASVMMIEGAERFGLAQLHQFRGRVGRSNFKSYCFLFPTSLSEASRERLETLEKTNDGFELAEKDLELRGPGTFLGKRQSGPADLMLSSLGDIRLVKKTRERAEEILEESPNLKNYPKLKKRLKRFSQEVHLE